MEKNWKKKYPIEVALEKVITNIGNSISWAIRVMFKFFFVIPKKKDEKTERHMELLGLFLIAVGWLLITYVRIVNRYF